MLRKVTYILILASNSLLQAQGISESLRRVYHFGDSLSRLTVNQELIDYLDSNRHSYPKSDSAYMFLTISLSEMNYRMGNYRQFLNNVEDLTLFSTGISKAIPGRMSSTYLNLGIFDSSFYFTNQIIKNDPKFGYFSKAKTYYYMDSFNDCIKNIQISKTYSTETHFDSLKHKSSISYFMLASLSELNQLDSAKQYAIELEKNTTNKSVWDYLVLAKYYFFTGDKNKGCNCVNLGMELYRTELMKNKPSIQDSPIFIAKYLRAKVQELYNLKQNKCKQWE